MSWKEDLRAPDLTSETFTRVMSEAAHEQLDADVRVAGPFALHVNAGERVAFQCNLQGLWQKDIVGCDPEKRQGRCEDYLQALQERMEQRTAGHGSAEPDPADLRPVIQSRAFVQHADEQYEEAGLTAHLCADPLAADLCTVYVLDRSRSIAFVSSQQLDSLGMTEEEMAERARRNLREAFAETELDVLTLEGEGITTYKVAAPGGLLASSLPLAREVPEQFAARVEGNLVAVVPARDELFFAGDERREDVAILHRMGEKLFGEDRHPVSPTLVAWRGDQWEAYEAL